MNSVKTSDQIHGILATSSVLGKKNTGSTRSKKFVVLKKSKTINDFHISMSGGRFGHEDYITRYDINFSDGKQDYSLQLHVLDAALLVEAFTEMIPKWAVEEIKSRKG